MRPILFLVSAASSYRLLKRVAEQLVRDGRPVAFLYERGADDTFEMIKADAAAMHAPAFALEAMSDPAIQSGPVWRGHPRRERAQAMSRLLLGEPSVLDRLRGRFSMQPPRPAVPQIALPHDDRQRFTALHAILASQLAAASAVFAKVKPGAMVACEDGIAAALPVHAAAREKDIPVVVVPYGYGVRRDLEIALDAKAARGELMTAGDTLGVLLRDHAPQWIKQGQHEGALMHPEAYIVAAESLGITLRDAWIIHGGDARRLCVESEQMRRVYLQEGVPEPKLALTGSPYCDVMMRGIEHNDAARAALRQPRRIEPGTTAILVSWPPSYHHERSAFSEFSSYREMSLATLGWLASLPNCVVKVSLHPATLAEDREAVVATGAALTDEYVIEQIPQHDLFITYFSSTIRWAIAAGKPVVNFDLYRLGLPVYDDAPGVKLVNSLADFQREVTALTTSDEAFAAAAQKNIAVAPEWGMLDGRCTERVAEEIATVAG